MSRIILTLTIFLTFLPGSFSQTSWVELNSGVTSRLNVIVFKNSFTGYAGGQNSVLIKTTNGGINWFSSNSGIGQVSISRINFASSDTGYVLADSLSYTRMYKTTNGGLSWFIVMSQTFYKDISFINGSTGYSAGMDVYKTTNGGVNWVNQFLQNTWYTTAIYMINELTGYVAGARTQHPLDATSISFTQNGASWELPYSSSGYTLFKMGNFYDRDNGIFISTGGTIYRKKNGGAFQIDNLILESIDYITANTVLACGSSGVILKSTNGGDNWFNSVSGVNVNLYSIFFTDVNQGFVCGDGGKILKTTNGGGAVGLHNLTTELPSQFSLSQNYPNPFNPVTNIKFQMPKSGFAKITAFDVLGKEVKTLVNRQLSPGTYEADFDGSNLPSGVYYYQLTVSNEQLSVLYKETKKMVLVK